MRAEGLLSTTEITKVDQIKRTLGSLRALSEESKIRHKPFT